MTVGISDSERKKRIENDDMKSNVAIVVNLILMAVFIGYLFLFLGK